MAITYYELNSLSIKVGKLAEWMSDLKCRGRQIVCVTQYYLMREISRGQQEIGS